MGDIDFDVQNISSASNPLIKLARQLGSRRRARHREGLYLVEGIRAVQAVADHGGHFHTLIIDEPRRGEIAPALFVSLAERARRIVTVTPELFHTISDAEHPQSLIAVTSIPELSLPANATSIVALDAVREPGNMGTIIRTACAAGVDGIALLPGCVDPFNPKAVRASAGMVAAIPIGTVQAIEDLVANCFSSIVQINVVAADADGSVDYRDVHWEEPVIVVVGNEASGLSEETRRTTTQMVRIPMAHGVESLNVSVATGVILFEMRSVRSGRGA